MGARFRLRADFDFAGYDPDVQVILGAMQRDGVILADNGRGCPQAHLTNLGTTTRDEPWDNREGRGRQRLQSVDAGALQVASGSMGRALRLYGPCSVP